MTREEKAIIYFKDMRKRLCEDHLNICPKGSIAYKATLAEKDFYDTAIKALEQELCTDAISRQAALNLLKPTGLKFYDFITDARNKIKELPSVTPVKKVGHWVRDTITDIYHCSECRSICHQDPKSKDDYCKYCGAKMEDEDAW